MVIHPLFEFDAVSWQKDKATALNVGICPPGICLTPDHHSNIISSVSDRSLVRNRVETIYYPVRTRAARPDATKLLRCVVSAGRCEVQGSSRNCHLRHSRSHSQAVWESSASFLGCWHDTARICCCAPASAIDQYLLPTGRSAANPLTVVAAVGHTDGRAAYYTGSANNRRRIRDAVNKHNLGSVGFWSVYLAFNITPERSMAVRLSITTTVYVVQRNQWISSWDVSCASFDLPNDDWLTDWQYSFASETHTIWHKYSKIT